MESKPSMEMFIELQKQVLTLTGQLDQVLNLCRDMAKALQLATSILKDHDRFIEAARNGTTGELWNPPHSNPS